MKNYRIIGVQGDPADPKGQVVTLERIKKEPSQTRNYLITILSVFFSALIIGGIWILASRENTEIPHKELSTVENKEQFVSESTPNETPSPEFYSDKIPLTYSQQKALHDAAEEFDVPYELALAVIWQETKFENVYGDNGNAYGYFQVWPKRHEERMKRLGVTDLNDPESNFRVGCSILGDALRGCGGDVHKALMVYNAGATGARKLWENGYLSSRYSRAVVDYMEEGLV